MFNMPGGTFPHHGDVAEPLLTSANEATDIFAACGSADANSVVTADKGHQRFAERGRERLLWDRGATGIDVAQCLERARGSPAGSLERRLMKFGRWRRPRARFCSSCSGKGRRRSG